MQQNEIDLPRWIDRHLHVRDGAMTENVLPSTLAQCAEAAIIMPNLMKPDGTPDPVDTVEKARAYGGRIRRILPPGSTFEPLLTCYLTDSTTPDEVERGFEEGAWRAAKLYMVDQKGEGGTTGSHAGVRNLLGRYPVFERMQAIGMPLLGHFEAVEIEIDGREIDEFDRARISAHRDYRPVRRAFPDLPIVFEHLTDGDVADMVSEDAGSYPTYATVTAHHLHISRNALFRGGLNPLMWCKPVAKHDDHRRRVREYVTGGHRSFGAGTDSAPHDVAAKSRCCRCAAGIFTAPHAVELYAMAFDRDGGLANLGDFLSVNFTSIYGFYPSGRTMKLVRQPRLIPESVGSVRTFWGGETIPWTLLPN